MPNQVNPISSIHLVSILFTHKYMSDTEQDCRSGVHTVPGEARLSML